LHAGRKLESAGGDRQSITAWLAAQPAILDRWRQAKRKHAEVLTVSGFAPSIKFLNELMFEPAEADFFADMGRRLNAL
jgi:hypothetical protein